MCKAKTCWWTLIFLKLGLNGPIGPFNPRPCGQLNLDSAIHSFFLPFGTHDLPFGHQGLPFGHQGLPLGHQGLPFGHQGLPFGHHGLPFGHQGLTFGHQGLPFDHQGPPFGNQQLRNCDGITKWLWNYLRTDLALYLFRLN